MFKTREGGGVKGRLNNVKKNCTIGAGWLPLWDKTSLINNEQCLLVEQLQ